MTHDPKSVWGRGGSSREVHAVASPALLRFLRKLTRSHGAQLKREGGAARAGDRPSGGRV
jgi:hypothetical protein